MGSAIERAKDGSTPHGWEPGRERDRTPVLAFRCLGWRERGAGGDSVFIPLWRVSRAEERGERGAVG